MHRLARLILAAALAVVLWLPQAAAAYDEQQVMVCAFRQALAILTCKKPDRFSFVGIRQDVYVFNSFFGKGFVEFYVQINGDLAIFTSRAWHGRMPSGRILRDNPAGCVNISVDELPCSSIKTAQCCGSP